MSQVEEHRGPRLARHAKGMVRPGESFPFAEFTGNPVRVRLLDGTWREGHLRAVNYTKSRSLSYVQLQLETDAAGKRSGQVVHLHKNRIDFIEFYDPNIWVSPLERLLEAYVNGEMTSEDTPSFVVGFELGR